MDKIDMINQADNAGNVKYGGNRDKGKALTGFRTVLLRLLSSLAVHMYLYACFTLIRRVLFYDDGGAISVVIYACSAVSAWLAGTLLIGRSCYYSMKLSQVRLSRFIAFSLGIRDMDRAISALTAWLLMIVPAAAPFVIFREYGVLKPLFESAAAACAYIVALKHTQKSPAGIINGGGFYAGLVLLATCLELPYFVDGLSYLRPWFFGALYFLILIYLLVRNQKDIDENIYDKKFVEKSILPKNLRRFNTVSIIFVYLVILLLSNFRAVVSRLIGLAWEFVRIAGNAILWLLERIGPDGAQIENPGMEEESMTPVMSAPPSPYLNLIFNILKYFIAFYLLYRLVPVIVRNIPVIASKLAALFRKLFRIKKENGAYMESDYVDVAEIVLPERRGKTVRVARRRKRRTARHLRKITDPAEKIRYMYGLILDILPARGIKPEASDTTAEILSKTAREKDLGGLHPFTAIYDKVRYGDAVPDNETLGKAEEYYTGTYDAIRGRPQ